jgi:hypothetical protein
VGFALIRPQKLFLAAELLFVEQATYQAHLFLAAELNRGPRRVL